MSHSLVSLCIHPRTSAGYGWPTTNHTLYDDFGLCHWQPEVLASCRIRIDAPFPDGAVTHCSAMALAGFQPPQDSGADRGLTLGRHPSSGWLRGPFRSGPGGYRFVLTIPFSSFCRPELPISLGLDVFVHDSFQDIQRHAAIA
jgi:hypothetical protein